MSPPVKTATLPWHVLLLTFLAGVGLALMCSSASFTSPQKSWYHMNSSSTLDAATSSLDDAVFLGPPQGDAPPPRRPEYVFKTNTYQTVYDETWTKGGYPSQSCWGCRFASDVVSKLPFHTVLDAGTGNGFLVRQMRSYGKSAWGIELSKAVLEQECPDLLKTGVVENGVLTNLPYEDNSFDLVFSADVLEHIHPEEADAVISELVRVSRRHLFLSISLKGHTKVTADNDAEANRHTMLRPRSWWEAKFREHGAVVNKEMLWAMQRTDTSYARDAMQDCRTEGSGTDGGTYEVPWLTPFVPGSP